MTTRLSRNWTWDDPILPSLIFRDDKLAAARRKAARMAEAESAIGLIPVLGILGKSWYGDKHVYQRPESFLDPFSRDRVDNWFKNLEIEAADAGNPMPVQSVVDEARRIVLGLRSHLPNDSDVYTMEDGKIAVEVFGAPGRGFLMICEPGGSALCIVTIDGVSRRARYESSAILPDGFLKEGLREVGAASWPGPSDAAL